MCAYSLSYCDFPYPGTCLSFSSEDKSLFVVGSENGGLFKCSMQASVSIGDTPISKTIPHHMY